MVPTSVTNVASSGDGSGTHMVTEVGLREDGALVVAIAASTFKVRVHRLKQNRDAQREALALVTEECGSSSQLSDETAYDENKVVRTRAAERRQNPQLLFEQVVREVSRSVITAAEGPMLVFYSS